MRYDLGMTAKEEALALIQGLPSDVSFKLISERVFQLALNRGGDEQYTDVEIAEINAAIAQGDADIEAGRFKTQEDMRRTVRAWAKEWNSK